MLVYVCAFYGQGGRVFSGGVVDIARKLQQLGCKVDVWDYTDVLKAKARLDWFRKRGDKIVMLGFSLGTSAETYEEAVLHEACDLLIAIAMSSFESRWKIDKKIVKRAVLWHGDGPLSNAGTDLGFDKIIDVHFPPVPFLGHLMMPDIALDGVVAEVRRLI